MARLVKTWIVAGGTTWHLWCDVCQTSGGYSYMTYLVTDLTIHPARLVRGCTTCEPDDDEEADQ